jgi:hypothetical protein
VDLVAAALAVVLVAAEAVVGNAAPDLFRGLNIALFRGLNLFHPWEHGIASFSCCVKNVQSPKIKISISYN